MLFVRHAYRLFADRPPVPLRGRGLSAPRQPHASSSASARMRAQIATVCGRFITNRSARASKDHHCIFGLQTSSHSPGPREQQCAGAAQTSPRQREQASRTLRRARPGGGPCPPCCCCVVSDALAPIPCAARRQWDGDKPVQNWYGRARAGFANLDQSSRSPGVRGR